MSCEDLKPELMGLIYGEAEAEARQRVESHLASCSGCRQERERLEEIRGLLREHLAEPDSIPGIALSAQWRRAPLSGGAEERRWVGLRRLAVAAALLLAVPLVVLAAANSRIQKDASGWSVQFSLRSEAARGSASVEKALREAQQRLEVEVRERLERQHEETMKMVALRLEEARAVMVRDLSQALARQEQALSAGYRSDKEEILRRDRAVEQMVGSEINRTREMIGAVLAASEPKLLEQ